MRIFGSLLSVLIVGILSSSVAQRNDDLWYWMELRDKCERNGGPTAFDNYNYTASVENLAICFERVVNLPQLETEVTAAGVRHTDSEFFFQRYRLRIPTFKACLQRSIDHVDSCLDPAERQSLYILSGAAESWLQYASQNEEVVRRFFHHGGRQCVASKYESILSCTSRSFTSFSGGSTGLIIPVLGVVPNLSVNLEGCREMQSFQNCVVNVLEACNDPSTAEIISYLLDLLKSNSNCATQIQIEENLRSQRQNESPVDYFPNPFANRESNYDGSRIRSSPYRRDRFH